MCPYCKVILLSDNTIVPERGWKDFLTEAGAKNSAFVVPRASLTLHCFRLYWR